MNTELSSADSPPSRLIVVGSAALTQGFSLVGLEVIADATEEQLETLLAGLVQNGETAMVIVEDYLANSRGRWLHQVRNESGRVMVIEVPGLHAPAEYHPPVEDLVRSILGPSAIGEEV